MDEGRFYVRVTDDCILERLGGGEVFFRGETSPKYFSSSEKVDSPRLKSPVSMGILLASVPYSSLLLTIKSPPPLFMTLLERSPVRFEVCLENISEEEESDVSAPLMSLFMAALQRVERILKTSFRCTYKTKEYYFWVSEFALNERSEYMFC